MSITKDLPPGRGQSHSKRCIEIVRKITNIFEAEWIANTTKRRAITWILAKSMIKLEPAERQSATYFLKWAKMNSGLLRGDASLLHAPQKDQAPQPAMDCGSGQTQARRPMQYIHRANGKIEVIPQPAQTRAHQPSEKKADSEDAATEIPNDRKTTAHRNEDGPVPESTGRSKRQKVSHGAGQ